MQVIQHFTHNTPPLATLLPRVSPHRNSLMELYLKAVALDTSFKAIATFIQCKWNSLLNNLLCDIA